MAENRHFIAHSSQHRMPEGLRAYAVGDIHGRLDLLQSLLEKIHADSQDCGGEVHYVFLGDFIDRGLNSRGVIQHLVESNYRASFLLGNHEQVMRDLLTADDMDLASAWLRFGGRETLLSYGVRAPVLDDRKSLLLMLQDMRSKVPSTHQDFLKDLQQSEALGDYFFCHAGVRPGVPLDQQTEADLAWIRREFIPHTDPYEKMVVHGHTIQEAVDIRPNRIGIDTGAYATGCLTALALEGNTQWILQTAA